MTSAEFASFVQQKTSRLHRYAYFLVREKEEARDILQETFADLWIKRERLDSYNSLEALALNIIRNKSIDRMRSYYRKGNLEQELRKQFIDVVEETPETLMEEKNALSIIDNIVCNLPPEQREILFLKNVEGLTCGEISDLLGVKVNTVEVTLSRIRKTIRAKYESIQLYKSI